MRSVRQANLLLLLLLAGLVGCQPSPDRPAAHRPPAGTPQAAPPPPASALAPPPVPQPAPVTSLAGAWRVGGIDGIPFNEPYGLALRGDPGKLWWEPLCAGMARGYTIRGSSISFRSLRPPRPPGSPPEPVCAIGLPPRLGDVIRALDAATTIERTPQNGILIAGGGHNLTLFSQ